MDTHRFRQATWYYIHSIKGIRHDDYHYRNVCTLNLVTLSNFFFQVNVVLDRVYKTYIRMVSQCDSTKGTTPVFVLATHSSLLFQVACFPEQVTKFDFFDCMQGLDYSEKVSLCQIH